ncbi:unnamed protein product [Camellia sinensis]
MCKKLNDDDKIQQQSLNEKNESVSEMSSQGKVLDEGSEKQNQPESLRKRKTGSGAGKDNISDAPNGSTHHIKSTVEKELSQSPSNLVFGYLNLFCDGLHNFTDGMALGSVFLLYGSVGGWSRTLFLLAHELPQEALVMGQDQGQSSLIEVHGRRVCVHCSCKVLAEMNNGSSSAIKSTVLQLTSLTSGIAVTLCISLVE